MRYLLCTLVLSAIALPARPADDPPKPNPLSPKETADGWIMLFDGETLFGWTVPEGDKWTIKDGLLSPQAGNKGMLMTTTEFSDYELRFEYQATGSDGRVLIACERDAKPGSETVPLRQGNEWSRATVIVKGGRIAEERIESLGAGAGSARGSTGKGLPRRGHIGLAGNGFVIRNLRLKPAGTTSVFNGKDLTGWKEFKADAAKTKSKFTVTPEGWLNIKDGPGDLQTEGQYGDFVLQLDCISNGKHLNSGVFFRCRPGEYQQGYEAQVRNQFTAEPTQEYVIEVFDPKTGELKEKQKIKSTAFDYGTGAIYRRMPARKEMSKDGEWFTMTLVAHGPHIATWVNGVQVADWTDNRPVKDNARAGCRLEKGPISLQGHDPTTDLSFRNMRIAELPAAAK